MNRRLLLVAASGALLFVIVVAFVLFSVLRKPANITLAISPAAAKATLDGNKSVKSGSFYVTPGKHVIKASFSGFSTNSISFTIAAGSAKPKAVNLILATNSKAGVDYLTKHPADEKVREAVGGAAFSQTTQTIQDKYPIVKKLPYVGPGNSYRIDYGPAYSGAGDDSAGNNFSIFITFYGTGGDQAALQWIQDQGYDPSTLPITYNDDTSDTSQTQIDNQYAN